MIAQSQPVRIQKRSIYPAPVNGFSVQNPLRATFYAFKRGEMKVLVPFEITIITPNGFEPEVRAPIQPISGQIRPQQGVNQYPSQNANTYRQYPQAQFGPTYYRPATYQPYAYAPYHGYNNYNYNYNSQVPNRAPYYSYSPYPSSIRPGWPLYRPLQVGK